jgi:hypothetical protein
MFRSPACPVPDISGTPLGKRQMYLEAFALSQRLIQNSNNSGASTSSALENSITSIVSQLQRQCPRLAMVFSFGELSRICGAYIRYGSYWNVFKTSLQTDEVLLINPRYSFDRVNPNTTFDSATRIWLCQELGLKQFCQKLSGLSQMISDLARTEANSEERAFLAAKIPDRLEEVLGPRPVPTSGISYPSSFFPVATEGSLLEAREKETKAGYLLNDPSVCGEESDDGLSMYEGTFQAVLGSGYFNPNAWKLE